MNQARKVVIAELPEDRPMALIARRRIVGEKMMVSHIVLQKGFSVGTHAHENEQISIVQSGRFRFRVGADGAPDRRTIEVGAGEALVLPANVPHSGEALEDSVILDLFSPPSERTGVDSPRDG
ncbi:MAG TPA: cupin domain-containing protein [Phycisphaerales bacterium]|nr:cupin domain-containing protein [Phycisphaerales bacterium]